MTPLWRDQLEQAAEILRRVAAGKRPTLIAWELNIDVRTVRKWAKRGQLPPERTCDGCGRRFRARDCNTRFCCPKCGDYTGRTHPDPTLAPDNKPNPRKENGSIVASTSCLARLYPRQLRALQELDKAAWARLQPFGATSPADLANALRRATT